MIKEFVHILRTYLVSIQYLKKFEFTAIWAVMLVLLVVLCYYYII